MSIDPIEATRDVLMAVGLVIAAPAIGAIGLPIMLLKAAVHGVMLSYHWQMSKNENGVALVHDEDVQNKWKSLYIQGWVASSSEKDLSRLEHQLKAEQQEDEASDSVTLAMSALALLVPVVGVVFAAIISGGRISLSSTGKKEAREREDIQGFINDKRARNHQSGDIISHSFANITWD